MSWTTPDLYDARPDAIDVFEGNLMAFGRRPHFHGPIRTLKVFEDNALVKSTLGEPGDGHVLVVDGGGSMRTALVGDQLAARAIDHGWAGLVIHGCIRDSVIIDTLEIGVRCLGTTPRRSQKHGFGEKDIAVRFGGLRFVPGHHVYVDQDGLLLSAARLPEADG